MITKYNEYIKENKTQFSFKEITEYYVDNWVLELIYDKEYKEYIIKLDNIDADDEDIDEDLLHSYLFYQKVYYKHITDELFKLLNINNMKELKLDTFLVIRYLLIIHNNADDIIKKDISTKYFYDYLTFVNMFEILNKMICTFKNTFNYDVIKFVEGIININKNIFNNNDFNEIIYNNEYLYQKYEHLLNAKKFDLID